MFCQSNALVDHQNRKFPLKLQNGGDEWAKLTSDMIFDDFGYQILERLGKMGKNANK